MTSNRNQFFVYYQRGFTGHGVLCSDLVHGTDWAELSKDSLLTKYRYHLTRQRGTSFTIKMLHILLPI